MKCSPIAQKDFLVFGIEYIKFELLSKKDFGVFGIEYIKFELLSLSLSKQVLVIEFLTILPVPCPLVGWVKPHWESKGLCTRAAAEAGQFKH